MPIEIICAYCGHKLKEIDLVKYSPHRYPPRDINYIVSKFKGKKCPKCGKRLKGENLLAVPKRNEIF